MSNRIQTLIVALALAVIIPCPALAQEEETNKHQRSGFFIGFGLGYGALAIEDVDGTEGAPSGMLRLGGTLSDKWLLGIETNGWSKTESGVTVTFGSLAGAAQFYPSSTAGFFLSGGLGLGIYSVEGFDSETGLSLLLGLGYDIRVGSNISISPFLNGYGSSINGVTVSVGQIGVGITFH